MNLFGEKLFTSLTGKLQDVEHCSLLNITKTRRSAHAIAFHEAVKDHCDLLSRKAHIFAEWLLLWLSEALTALLAFEALNFVPSVETGLDHLDPAIVTSHCKSP